VYKISLNLTCAALILFSFTNLCSFILSASAQSPSGPEERVNRIERDIGKLNEEISKLRDETTAKIDRNFYIAGAIAALLVVVPTFLALWRSREEKATIALVNQLLQTTHEATSRAIGAQDSQLQDRIDKLESESLAFIRQNSDIDIRGLISRGENESRVKEISEHIAGLQLAIQLFAGPRSQAKLKPAGLFLRGLAYHVAQQYRTAAGYWRLSADERNDELKKNNRQAHADYRYMRSVALYWLGIGYNNSEQYDEACATLKDALDHDPDAALYYELERMHQEALFFKYGKDGLLDEIDDHIKITEQKKV